MRMPQWPSSKASPERSPGRVPRFARFTSALRQFAPEIAALLAFAAVTVLLRSRGLRLDAHALRFTAEQTRRAFVFPARHFASDLTDPNLPAMGQRLRLKRGYEISRFPRQARIVLRALKRYGMILADNGSSWYVSGAPDPRWSNDQLHTLGRVPGSAFEVVRFPRR